MYKTYLATLRPLISFRSISTDSCYCEDIAQAADYLRSLFELHGFSARLIDTASNPVVYARYTVNPKLPTCLIYGHYDVQPADNQPDWQSDPFTLTEHNKHLYGRGVADNKGQLAVHLTAISKLIRANKLRYNIIFLVEGDEESNSQTVEQLILEQPDLFAADFVMVSDGQTAGNRPTMELGFRGAMSITLDVRTSHNDLHSGLYGGMVPNAAQELATILGTLHSDNGSVAVEGFYQGAPKSVPEIPFDMDEIREITGVKKLYGKDSYSCYFRSAAQPSLSILSLESGHIGEGFRNSIPGFARAKMDARLAPGQQVETVITALEKHLKKVTPQHVSCDLYIEHPNAGVALSVDNEPAKRALSILEETYGSKPVLKYCGGSIPIVSTMAEKLKVPQLMVSFANEDCAMHGANENLNVDLVKKALAFSYAFFGE